MNEFDLIEKLFVPMTMGNQGAMGLKDDIAFIDGAIFTTDTLVEGVHFRPNDPFITIGQKLLRVNVSDILSKGARPDFALLNLSWNANKGQKELENFCAGLLLALKEFNIPLIGGDTTSTNGPIVASLTLKARPIIETPILRQNAKLGDKVFVSGNIGCAAIGLEAWEKGENNYEFCRTHYQIPQIPKPIIGDLIAKYANSSLDVSDGLLGDCCKLACNNEVKILLEHIPLHDEAKHWLNCQENQIEGLLKLVSFGDDYQCVFSVSPENVQNIEKAANKSEIKITQIGEIVETSAGGVFYEGAPITLKTPKSFIHKL